MSKKYLIRKKNAPYFIANLVLFILILSIPVVYFSSNLNIISAQDNNRNLNIVQNYPKDNLNKPEFEISTNATSSTNSLSSTNLDVFNPEDQLNSSLNYTEGLYLEIKDSCGVHYGGSCVRARACPSLKCPVIEGLRDSIVLKTDGKLTEADGITWYHAYFDEWVRYPDRMAQDIYIASDYVDLVKSYKAKYQKGEKKINVSGKKIIINLTEQKLYAYEPNGELFTEVSISTGLDDLPTPRGTFHIFEKTPSRYMQGPLPGISSQYYDLPGVPWTMYFTYQGAAIHGAYWHNNFGEQWSHGCVNLRPVDAKRLYKWAPLGTTVIVKD